jgi:hypothetical protein
MTGIQAGLGRSEHTDAARAVGEAVRQARTAIGNEEPELAFVTCTIDYDSAAIHRALREQLPRSEIHGITTSLGVLGGDGVKMGEKGAFGVLLLRGDGSTFVSAGGPIGKDARAAGVQVARALADRARGRRPALLLFNAAPGAEEDLLAGVGEVFRDVPAQGGSAADHAIAGDWRVITKDGVVPNGISLTGIFGDVKIGRAFMAPYRPSGEEARVTAAEGRRISKLDEKRASDVLRQWIGEGIANEVASGGNVLAQSSLSPLGVRHDSANGGSRYVAVHPAHIHKDGAVDVFARVPPGGVVCRLEGTLDGLIDGLATLVDQALASGSMQESDVKAALLTYCAGCAGAVGERLDAGLRKHVGARLPGVPVLGTCTFGEQGFIPGAGNVHSNLSLGLVLLGV